jgi:hypothetical protein
LADIAKKTDAFILIEGIGKELYSNPTGLGNLSGFVI